MIEDELRVWRGMRMPSNPVTLQVQKGAGAFWCFSNASYLQRVTLEISASNENPYVFEGSGEGQLMTCDRSGGPTLPFTEPADFTVTATFEYSETVDPPQFKMAHILKEPVVDRTTSRYIAQVESEDSTDEDDNDSWLQVVSWARGASAGHAG
ncbi:MAG TPA: hypothetical protein VEU29_08350 [Actinomycetota bacterium]|nr:hypothetical protein [Actinomycetota bacterium]